MGYRERNNKEISIGQSDEGVTKITVNPKGHHGVGEITVYFGAKADLGKMDRICQCAEKARRHGCGGDGRVTWDNFGPTPGACLNDVVLSLLDALRDGKQKDTSATPTPLITDDEFARAIETFGLTANEAERKKGGGRG